MSGLTEPTTEDPTTSTISDTERVTEPTEDERQDDERAPDDVAALRLLA